MPLVIMHSLMFHFPPPDARAAFGKTLRSISAERGVAVVSMEIAGPEARLGLIAGNPLAFRPMGRACIEGRWMAWR